MVRTLIVKSHHMRLISNYVFTMQHIQQSKKVKLLTGGCMGMMARTFINYAHTCMYTPMHTCSHRYQE